MTRSSSLQESLHRFLQQHSIRQGQRKHLEHALLELELLTSRSRSPARIWNAWRSCLAISVEAFILFSAALAPDTLRRAKNGTLSQAVEYVRTQQKSLRSSHLLRILAQEYEIKITKCISICLSEIKDDERPLSVRCEPRLEHPLAKLLGNQHFASSLPATFEQSRLEPLECPSQTTKESWLNATCTIPLLVSAKDCWGGPAPDFHTVFKALWKTKAPRVFQRGEQVDKSFAVAAFSQLAAPNPHNPTTIIGTEPRGLDQMFTSCSALGKHFPTHCETRMVFNVTPTYSVVDLHIDYGMDALSATMHNCSKVWLMYPPTDYNLKLLKTELRQPMRLARLAHRLEGGVFVETDSDQAVFIPSGCLHACFTTTGGFLVSIDCTTRMSPLPFSRYLSYDLHCDLDDEGQRDVYFKFLDTLEVAVMNDRVLVAVHAWLQAEANLRKFLACAPKCELKARSIFQQAVMQGRCPCGLNYLGSWYDHFLRRHVSATSKE